MRDGKSYLTFIIEKLQQRLKEVDSSISQGQKEIEGMHEYYWENYTEMDQYGYENFDNQQALLQQVNANQEQLALKHRLERMLNAPFSAEWISAMKMKTLRSPFISVSGTFRNKRDRFPISMTGGRLSAVFSTILTRVLPAMKLRPAFWRERFIPNGSIKSAAER